MVVIVHSINDTNTMWNNMKLNAVKEQVCRILRNADVRGHLLEWFLSV